MSRRDEQEFQRQLNSYLAGCPDEMNPEEEARFERMMGWDQSDEEWEKEMDELVEAYLAKHGPGKRVCRHFFEDGRCPKELGHEGPHIEQGRGYGVWHERPDAVPQCEHYEEYGKHCILPVEHSGLHQFWVRGRDF